MSWHWRHPENKRWQVIRLERDLIGNIVLVTRTGGSIRRGMAQRSYPVNSRKELRQLIRSIRGRRRRHQYQSSTGPGP